MAPRARRGPLEFEHETEKVKRAKLGNGLHAAPGRGPLDEDAVGEHRDDELEHEAPTADVRNRSEDQGAFHLRGNGTTLGGRCHPPKT